jgi:hypothetical protein
MKHASRLISLCSVGVLVGVLTALGTLTACAPLQKTPAPLTVGRGQLVLPPGDWVDLGSSDQDLILLPEVGDTLPLQTRAAGLRGPDGTWLAVLKVQTNSTNSPRAETRWTDTCPKQQGIWVEDATAGETPKGRLTSHVRIDCLRFRRLANHDGWMQEHEPVLEQWLSHHKVAPNLPYAYLHYRYATQGGAYVDVQAVVDQRLLRPPTHNNHEFLAAGRPGQMWMHALVQASRQSTGMLDGTLSIPPFPFPIDLPQ